jgi:hypothetical protein
MRRISQVAFIAGIVVPTLAGPAFGYLDPGTGSMILQALIGALVAGVTTVGIYWRRLTSIFQRGKASTQQNSSERSPTD